MEGDDRLMAGLAAAARREGGTLSGPMLAAILQQEARAWALDGDESACHLKLDEAHSLAAAADGPGDASAGHGSFCTPAYLEMQRGACWLTLGSPGRAVAALDTAIQSMPPAYRRDRGVALSTQAAAFAACGEPVQAAGAGTEALDIARASGSGRLLSMVGAVVTSLAGYGQVDAVVRLRAAAVIASGAVEVASAAEVAAMRRAIAVSAAALGTASPNPPVGCVLIGRDGELIAEGYHERKGEAHAEVQALAAAGRAAAGSTAVVTLEPCNHQGRTPPCRQALIDAGVRRVVVAVTDPTSRGIGGTAALRKAGVDVETEVLVDEARLILGSWLSATLAGRPTVTWPYVLAEDAVTALPRDSSEARTLELMADAILHADGRLTEAVAGSHGQDVLSLPARARGISLSVRIVYLGT